MDNFYENAVFEIYYCKRKEQNGLPTVARVNFSFVDPQSTKVFFILNPRTILSNACITIRTSQKKLHFSTQHPPQSHDNDRINSALLRPWKTGMMCFLPFFLPLFLSFSSLDS